MSRKLWVYTNDKGEIIAITRVKEDQFPADFPIDQIARAIPGQTIHELEIPSHLPEEVDFETLHKEIPKMLNVPS